MKPGMELSFKETLVTWPTVRIRRREKNIDKIRQKKLPQIGLPSISISLSARVSIQEPGYSDGSSSESRFWQWWKLYISTDLRDRIK